MTVRRTLICQLALLTGDYVLLASVCLCWLYDRGSLLSLLCRTLDVC